MKHFNLAELTNWLQEHDNPELVYLGAFDYGIMRASISPEQIVVDNNGESIVFQNTFFRLKGGSACLDVSTERIWEF